MLSLKPNADLKTAVERKLTAGLESNWIHIDQDRANLAAENRGGDHAGNAAQHVANIDAGQVVVERGVSQTGKAVDARPAPSRSPGRGRL